MIAGEAVERWRLPGIEVLDGDGFSMEEIKELWKPGLHRFSPSNLKKFADYPFNGIFGDAI